jgi:four helix bundle protein
MGSHMELQTQLILAIKLGFGDYSEFEKVESLASEVGRMLSAMVCGLRLALNSGP